VSLLLYELPVKIVVDSNALPCKLDIPDEENAMQTQKITWNKLTASDQVAYINGNALNSGLYVTFKPRHVF